MNAILKTPLLPALAPVGARLAGFSAVGQPLISLDSVPGSDTQPARSLCALAKSDIGAELLVVYTEGDCWYPVILGKVYPHPLADPPEAETMDVTIDGKQITLEASDRLELKCGKAQLSLQADGRIKIRGGYILNHASGINRIRGAAVKVN